MQFDIDNNDEIRCLICLQCKYRDLTKGGIKIHPSRKRNNLRKRYGVKSPFRPKTYQDMASINRHIQKQQCTYIKANIQTINWKDVWAKICLASNPPHPDSSIQQRNLNTNLENEPSS